MKRTLLATAASVALAGSANAISFYGDLGITDSILLSPTVQEKGKENTFTSEASSNYTNLGGELSLGVLPMDEYVKVGGSFNYLFSASAENDTALERKTIEQFTFAKKNDNGKFVNNEGTEVEKLEEATTENKYANYKSEIDYSNTFSILGEATGEFKYDFFSVNGFAGIGVGFPTAKVTLTPANNPEQKEGENSSPQTHTYESTERSYSLAFKGGGGVGFDLAEGVTFGISGYYQRYGSLNDEMTHTKGTEKQSGNVKTEDVLKNKAVDAIVVKASINFNM